MTSVRTKGLKVIRSIMVVAMAVIICAMVLRQRNAPKEVSILCLLNRCPIDIEAYITNIPAIKLITALTSISAILSQSEEPK